MIVVEHEFGSIKIHAEIKDRSDAKIQNLNDVTAKYSSLDTEQKEHLYAVFLTNANEEIGDKLIGLGGLGSVQLDIQDVVRTAALVNAGAVILVHNHPSGNPDATQQDIDSTREVYNALDQIGVNLLDHVIIARDDSYSMKANSDGPF